MTEPALRQLYEDPATPLSSGIERARLQTEMLTGIGVAAGRRLRAVDIGCGDGMATSVARTACYSVPGVDMTIVGFDWSMAALHQARALGVPVAQASAHAGLPLASDSVDIVIMSELIEHVVDTDAALAESRRVLAPGGTLLLSTPNLAAWYNRVLLAVGVQPLFTEVSLRGIYGRPGHDVVGHLRVFTRRALLGLLDANGFVSIEIRGAPYHDVPKLFKPLDRLLCRTPSLSSILLASARKPPSATEEEGTPWAGQRPTSSAISRSTGCTDELRPAVQGLRRKSSSRFQVASSRTPGIRMMPRANEG